MMPESISEYPETKFIDKDIIESWVRVHGDDPWRMWPDDSMSNMVQCQLIRDIRKLIEGLKSKQ